MEKIISFSGFFKGRFTVGIFSIGNGKPNFLFIKKAILEIFNTWALFLWIIMYINLGYFLFDLVNRSCFDDKNIYNFQYHQYTCFYKDIKNNRICAQHLAHYISLLKKVEFNIEAGVHPAFINYLFD